MTTKEQQTIDSLHSTVSKLITENTLYRQEVKLQIESIQKTVDQKQLPFNLEQEIISATQNSIAKALQEALGGCNSPLQQYAKNVVTKYQTSIESIFNDIVAEGITSDEFKVRVREVLLHKIAKTITSGIDGSIDKTINLMKQDAIFRSRLTLSVNTLVEEFLAKK